MEAQLKPFPSSIVVKRDDVMKVTFVKTMNR